MTSHGTNGSVPNHDPILLTSLVWKRRSGLRRYSDTLIGTKSSQWERRRLVLTRTGSLTYSAVEDHSLGGSSPAPRGAIHLPSEHATISATFLSRDAAVQQPTPYGLAVQVEGGNAAKWKLCFDDRNAQMAWLVALTDFVVEESVKEYNARVLSTETEKVERSNCGGFFRLYEESGEGLFGMVREKLLRDSEDDAAAGNEPHNITALVLERQYPQRLFSNVVDRSSVIEEIEVVGVQRMHQQRQLDMEPETSLVRNDIASQTMETDSIVFRQPHSSPREIVIARDKLHQMLLTMNLAIIYVVWTANSASCLAVPQWKFLFVLNAAVYYMCVAPVGCRNDSDVSINDHFNGANETIECHDTETVANQIVETTEKTVENVSTSKVSSEESFQLTPDDTSERTHCTISLGASKVLEGDTHQRWAISAPNVDLSGSWTLIVDESFKSEYSTYLKQLSFSRITRDIACSLISRTTEYTQQRNSGRELYLKGVNPKGTWERTLTASGYPDFDTSVERKEGIDYFHVKTFIKAADSEPVNAEAWWEEQGTVHRSFLRGGTKYGGGDFESLRYIEKDSNGNVLVCESIFHPKDKTLAKAVVKWRFQRNKI